LLVIVADLFMRTNPGAEAIAVPITSPAETDLIARERGVKLLKTRNSHLAMMEAASNKGVKFVGGTRGGFIFTDFFFAADAMYSVAKILEMMALTDLRLGEIDAGLPRLASSQRAVNCSWEHKGKVMRNIMHHSEGKRRDLVDGVKIYFDDEAVGIAVLLIPDKERPVFHIYSQARDQGVADRIVSDYEKKIMAWRDEP